MPTPTPTPAPAPLTYNDYLRKYLEQFGVQGGGPTPTPTPSGAPAAAGGIPLQGPLGIGLGAKIGMSLANSGAVGTAVSPGFAPVALGTPTTALPALTAMLPGGAAAPVAAGTAGTAATGAATAAGPTGVLTGASPLAYYGTPAAFLLAGSALAPSIAKGGEKIGKFFGITDDKPKRPYDYAVVKDSRRLNQQFPELAAMEDAKRQEILGKLAYSMALRMPGNALEDPLKLEKSAESSSFVLPHLSDRDKEHYKQKYGWTWANKIASKADVLSDVVDRIKAGAAYDQTSDRLGNFLDAYDAIKGIAPHNYAPTSSPIAEYLAKVVGTPRAPTGPAPTSNIISFMESQGLPARPLTSSPGISKSGTATASYWRKK